MGLASNDLSFEDWENDTLVNAPTHGSYVGRAPRAEDDLHERRHAELVRRWSDLRDTSAIETWDLSTKAAADVLAARVADLAHVIGLLARVSKMSSAPEDGVLTAYVAGCYLWLDGVIAALGALATQLSVMSPDWAAFRTRLADVAWIWDLAQREKDASLASDEARELFVAMVEMKSILDQPFG